jgi:flagellar motor protein MotB
MKDKHSILAVLFFFILVVLHPLQTSRADPSDGSDDGTKKTYYWQGNQLNNLDRLGNNADFEEEQRRTREGKDADQYLTSLREQMTRKAQGDAQERTALTFQGQLKGDPIELTALSPGLRVTLHADALFDENSATMKVGGIDTLERLHALLQNESQKPLQFVIADTIDDFPAANNLDAERSLVVLSMLQMPTQKDNQEDLSPEVLTR